MKSVNPTEDQLIAMFADSVCRFKITQSARVSARHGECVHVLSEEFSVYAPIPPFTSSFAAVLPWLEKWRNRPYLYRMAQIDMTGTGWLVKLHDCEKPDLIVKAEDPVLARAIVLALLPHYGVEVEFT